MMRVSEIVTAEAGGYVLEDIYRFEQTGVNDQGVATGEFQVTGYRPRCLDRIRASGVDLPDSAFAPQRVTV